MWRTERSFPHGTDPACGFARHSMQVTDELIRSVVQEVLAHMHNGRATPAANGKAHAWGVFDDVNAAVAAAVEAQRQFEARGLEERRKAVQCIRKICSERAEELGRDELA